MQQWDDYGGVNLSAQAPCAHSLTNTDTRRLLSGRPVPRSLQLTLHSQLCVSATLPRTCCQPSCLCTCILWMRSVLLGRHTPHSLQWCRPSSHSDTLSTRWWFMKGGAHLPALLSSYPLLHPPCPLKHSHVLFMEAQPVGLTGMSFAKQMPWVPSFSPFAAEDCCPCPSLESWLCHSLPNSATLETPQNHSKP